MYRRETNMFVCITATLIFSGCSPGNNKSTSENLATTTFSQTSASQQLISNLPTSSATATATTVEAVPEVSFVVPFSADIGTGTVEISGVGSPVVTWFDGLPGEVSLDLADADVGDAVSVVEELVSFWFLQDDDSGDVQSSILEPTIGKITDAAGTSYAAEVQLLKAAPVTETTTTRSSSSTASTTTSPAPETSQIPSVTASSTTATSCTTTSTVADSTVILQVQELNRSGLAGAAAGRMTDKLPQAVYAVLSPSETPQRYISSDVYFAEGRQAKAEDTLQAEEMGEIDQPISIPRTSLEKIKSNLLSVFDVRGFLSITTFIVSRQ